MRNERREFSFETNARIQTKMIDTLIAVYNCHPLIDNLAHCIIFDEPSRELFGSLFAISSQHFMNVRQYFDIRSLHSSRYPNAVITYHQQIHPDAIIICDQLSLHHLEEFAELTRLDENGHRIIKSQPEIDIYFPTQ